MPCLFPQLFIPLKDSDLNSFSIYQGVCFWWGTVEGFTTFSTTDAKIFICTFSSSSYNFCLAFWMFPLMFWGFIVWWLSPNLIFSLLYRFSTRLKSELLLVLSRKEINCFHFQINMLTEWKGCSTRFARDMNNFVITWLFRIWNVAIYCNLWT